MANLTWLPKYLKKTASFRPKQVMTNSEMNEWLNLIVTQGDNNTDGIKAIIADFLNSTDLTTHNTDSNAHPPITRRIQKLEDSFISGPVTMVQVNEAISKAVIGKMIVSIPFGTNIPTAQRNSNALYFREVAAPTVITQEMLRVSPNMGIKA